MTQPTALPVKYIGHRPTYREGAYDSGLIFTQGETKLVPETLAVKLLRHPDVYVPGETKAAPKAVAEVKPEAKPEQDTVQDLRDQIATMDKTALEHYAKTYFRVDLDKRKGVDSLRAQVTQMIDQYGAPEA